MTRLYGWAPRGERLVDKVPHGHWKTATFLAALRCSVGLSGMCAGSGVERDGASTWKACNPRGLAG